MLYTQIEQDFQKAFKNHEQESVALLRLLKATLTNKKIEKKMGKEEILPDVEVIALLKSEIKKRQDSITMYEQGGRPELAKHEKDEIILIEKYLPAQMSDEKLIELVKSTISEIGPVTQKDFGRVMSAVMAKADGQADGQAVSATVKQQLSI
ncbi:MAG: GatB/YqeY domain-containing protein [bacterium]